MLRQSAFKFRYCIAAIAKCSILMILLLAQNISFAESGAKLVVVVSKNNGVNELSKEQVVNIYMGRYSDVANKNSLVPVDYPENTSTKSAFYQALVGQSEKRIKSYWSRLLFSGRARPPISMKNAAEIAKKMQTNSSLIAYLPKEELTEEMKIVFQF